jgi:hypothetical protein
VWSRLIDNNHTIALENNNKHLPRGRNKAGFYGYIGMTKVWKYEVKKYLIREDQQPWNNTIYQTIYLSVMIEPFTIEICCVKYIVDRHLAGSTPLPSIRLIVVVMISRSEDRHKSYI